MAYPASRQTKVDGFQQVNNAALQLKRFAKNRRDDMARGDVPASMILGTLTRMREAIELFDRVAAISGIGAYVQDQFDDAGIDVATEFNAMRSAAVSARDLIIMALPADVDGWLLLTQLNADGSQTERQFTSAQTASLRTELDALIATIG